MTKALVKWLLLPLAGTLIALDAWSLIEALEFGDPYTWLVSTGWTTWLGLSLLVVGILLLRFFRVRPEYGVWFSYIPFVRMWKQMHLNGLCVGTVRFRGAQWEVKLKGNLREDNPNLEVRLSGPDDAAYIRDARRVRRLALTGHELYLRGLLRYKLQ